MTEISHVTLIIKTIIINIIIIITEPSKRTDASRNAPAKELQSAYIMRLVTIILVQIIFTMPPKNNARTQHIPNQTESVQRDEKTMLNDILLEQNGAKR